MTTVVIDIRNRIVVTDGRVTNDVGIKRKRTWLLSIMVPQYDPWVRETRVLSDNYYNKFYRIRDKHGTMIFCCAAGNVREITEFLDIIKGNKKLPKNYLKNSIVLMVYYDGDEIKIKKSHASHSCMIEYTDWVVIGSGQGYASGAMTILSEHDKNRAYKAVSVAAMHDESTGGTPRVYHLDDFDDIH